MRMGSENSTVAQWYCSATFIKYEIKQFVKTIILKFGDARRDGFNRRHFQRFVE